MMDMVAFSLIDFFGAKAGIIFAYFLNDVTAAFLFSSALLLGHATLDSSWPILMLINGEAFSLLFSYCCKVLAIVPFSSLWKSLLLEQSTELFKEFEVV